jgi:energy-coupling factor transporter ATP-binding protein EcfA2
MLFSGVSFDLQSGDAAIVTGPNGVGKSSLIRIAASLLAPFEGSVACEGAKALLTEASALDPDRTLIAALRFWAALDDAPVPDIWTRSRTFPSACCRPGNAAARRSRGLPPAGRRSGCSTNRPTGSTRFRSLDWKR